jgi:septal ring factor EnvC (AmiA/AmiB activator)
MRELQSLTCQLIAGHVSMNIKARMMHLHVLEREIVSQQQQLMQIKAEQQRVLDACRAVRKECSAALEEKVAALAEEKRHQAEEQQLHKEIVAAKVATV